MSVSYDFPDDENGDVLRRMQQGGDESSAEAFANHFSSSGFKVAVEAWDGKREQPWDVTVTRHMLPDHQGITEFEESLEELAAPLAGANDGWGCIRQSTQE